MTSFARYQLKPEENATESLQILKRTAN